jgi:hypothetical protein
MGLVEFMVFGFLGLRKLEVGYVRPRAGGGLLREHIACGVGGDSVNCPGSGVLGGAGGGIVCPAEAAEVEVVAVHGVEELVVGGVSGAGEAENFVGVVFGIQTPVGEVEGEGALSHLRGGGDSAGNRGAEELYDRGHGEVLRIKD